MPPDFTSSNVADMERKVMMKLKFKLVPDTLYFWFDLVVKLWDHFAIHGNKFDDVPLRTLKPMPVINNPEKYDPSINPFKLG